VQLSPVPTVNVTPKPEDAVAETVNESPGRKVRFAIAANEIV